MFDQLTKKLGAFCTEYMILMKYNNPLLYCQNT